jgi:hypothetical protein
MQKPWRAIDITKMLTYISLSQESAFTTHKMATVIFFNYLNDNQPPMAPHYGTWKFLQFSSNFFLWGLGIFLSQHQKLINLPFIDHSFEKQKNTTPKCAHACY